jgi:glycerophosphoryl diester phosphodiesterase
MDLGIPPIIGHRGARGLAPENTLAGLRAAFAHGVFYVEIDAKLTADGVVIVMHDETLDRTTNGRGRVAETPYEVIHTLNAAQAFPNHPPEPPPTLAAALELVQSVGGGINIEIKPCLGRERETAAAVIDVVRKTWHLPTLPLLSSFQRPSLEACRDLAPELPRGYLSEDSYEDWVAEAKALGCVTLNLYWKCMNSKLLPQLVTSGLPLILWTVNLSLAAKWLLNAGATSVITDYPDQIRR